MFRTMMEIHSIVGVCPRLRNVIQRCFVQCVGQLAMQKKVEYQSHQRVSGYPFLSWCQIFAKRID